MLARGVEKQNSVMKTSDIRGIFKDNEKARAELFRLI
jgi:GTP cyclohydrolase I